MEAVRPGWAYRLPGLTEIKRITVFPCRTVKHTVTDESGNIASNYQSYLVEQFSGMFRETESTNLTAYQS